MKQNKIAVAPPFLLIDMEIFDAKGRLVAKCQREDIAESLLIRLNSQPSLLTACEKSLEIFSKILKEYMERDEVGRRTKLPIEKLLENAIAKATPKSTK